MTGYTFINDSQQQDLYQSLKNSAILAEEMQLVAVLKPTLSLDGNMYCFLCGENVQNGVCGFGNSPYAAAIDFNKNFYKQETKQ